MATNFALPRAERTAHRQPLASLPDAYHAALIALSMTRAASTAPTLVGALWAAGLGSLAVITLASPGATRMHAWPWTLAYAIALAAPAAIVILRALDSQRPLVLPSRGWGIAAMLGTTAIVLSALASPYRAQSFLWSAPLLGGIAFFFAACDSVHGTDFPSDVQREKILRLLTLFLGVTAVVSLALWIDGSRSLGRGLAGGLAARNYYPLGHSNYTAGLALLLLPCAVALALRTAGARRLVCAAAAALALAQLFTSGSRGGVVGLAALTLGGFIAARWPRRKKLLLGLTLTAAGVVFAFANPRTRALLAPADLAAAPNISNVQRSAMLEAGVVMGLERPLLGWGPGTTPLVYPRHRQYLEGGVENALQLHSTPVQIWAELGLLGGITALAFLVLAARSARSQPAAALALGGYVAFSIFDWQLDVPVFAFAVAALAALLAPPRAAPASLTLTRALGAFALACLALMVALGRRDPTPELNARALALTVERSAEGDARAIGLLRESLALNPDQEIAHFNLGWLLILSDPAASEKHFRAAARLVPDKGGVYFGLGLARLNQARSDDAARAFALEGLNDPTFFASPYWRDPGIAALRTATAANFSTLVARAQMGRTVSPWTVAQLRSIANIEPGRVPDGPERAYRRERPGYPVLMRNLDLSPPLDVFIVREIAAAPDPALPPKGWLSGSILGRLLNETLPNPESKIENRK